MLVYNQWPKNAAYLRRLSYYVVCCVWYSCASLLSTLYACLASTSMYCTCHPRQGPALRKSLIHPHSKHPMTWIPHLQVDEGSITRDIPDLVEVSRGAWRVQHRTHRLQHRPRGWRPACTAGAAATPSAASTSPTASSVSGNQPFLTKQQPPATTRDQRRCSVPLLTHGRASPAMC